MIKKVSGFLIQLMFWILFFGLSIVFLSVNNQYNAWVPKTVMRGIQDLNKELFDTSKLKVIEEINYSLFSTDFYEENSEKALDNLDRKQQAVNLIFQEYINFIDKILQDLENINSTNDTITRSNYIAENKEIVKSLFSASLINNPEIKNIVLFDGDFSPNSYYLSMGNIPIEQETLINRLSSNDLRLLWETKKPILYHLDSTHMLILKAFNTPVLGTRYLIGISHSIQPIVDLLLENDPRLKNYWNYVITPEGKLLFSEDISEEQQRNIAWLNLTATRLYDTINTPMEIKEDYKYITHLLTLEKTAGQKITLYYGTLFYNDPISPIFYTMARILLILIFIFLVLFIVIKILWFLTKLLSKPKQKQPNNTEAIEQSQNKIADEQQNKISSNIEKKETDKPYKKIPIQTKTQESTIETNQPMDDKQPNQRSKGLSNGIHNKTNSAFLDNTKQQYNTPSIQPAQPINPQGKNLPAHLGSKRNLKYTQVNNSNPLKKESTKFITNNQSTGFKKSSADAFAYNKLNMIKDPSKYLRIPNSIPSSTKNPSTGGLSSSNLGKKTNTEKKDWKFRGFKPHIKPEIIQGEKKEKNKALQDAPSNSSHLKSFLLY